ncbi:MAG: peptide deformylase [Actinomycetes bacterium]
MSDGRAGSGPDQGRGHLRRIREVGDPVLRTACDPVEVFDDALRLLVADMFVTMADAEGVGLAANQVGVPLRLFVLDCVDDRGERHVAHVVNPQLERDGTTEEEIEGCLSVPGVHYATPRATWAAVTGVDLDGRPVRVEGGGLLARCLQHEVDHLDGRLYLDRLTGEARRSALADLRNRPG